MNMNRIRVEHALYVLAFALALTVRFLNLGAVPLSDVEANWALQALHASLGNSLGSQLVLGSQPAYIFLSGLSFSHRRAQGRGERQRRDAQGAAHRAGRGPGRDRPQADRARRHARQVAPGRERDRRGVARLRARRRS